MSKNSYESFSEDVSGCLGGCANGGCGCVALFLVAAGLASVAEWCGDNLLLASAIALAIFGGIVYLARKARRSPSGPPPPAS
jgi:hypothetical protein